MVWTVLITGASRGVGRECALAFARDGHRLACAARNAAELEKTATACSSAGAASAYAITMDVTRPDSVADGVARARAALGPIDVLVHAAGGATTAPFEKTTDAAWAGMLSLNLDSAFFITKAVLPDMLQNGRGRILYIGSTASRTGFRYCAAYAAAKHGLLGMARSLAAEVAGKNITVNVIGPGFLDVDATRAAADAVAARTGRSAVEILQQYAATSPQRRLVAPGEVAEVARFLASDAARGIHGQCLLVDGGGILS